MLSVLSLRLRLLLTVLVPTVALVAAVGYEVAGRTRVAEAAHAELARTDALEQLATVQAYSVLPEGADVVSRAGSLDGSMVNQLVLGGFWTEFTANYRAVDDARRQLAGPARVAVSPVAWDAFERQRSTAEALIAAVAAGTTVPPEVISEAKAARWEADLALADLAQASSSDSWIVYIGAIDATRAGQVEFASLFPTLAGIPVATSDELGRLAGERTIATERVILALTPELRVIATQVLASDDNTRWQDAVARADAVASGREPPLALTELVQLTLPALNLQRQIMEIAAQAVTQVRMELTATAHDAEHLRRQLLVLGGTFTLVTLILTAWILHSITAPLRRLTRRVAAVAQGELGAERVTIRGHDELARLGATIEDVAHGLQHLERQMRAMAAGDLDDPSLQMATPGPVGAYVQQRLDDLRRASGQLRAEAASDPLTGLLNRRALADAVHRAPPPIGERAVLYVDLDRFKLVNDRHGHGHGDAVLQAVAARLTGLVRDDDMVARVGGDEFVLVVEGLEPDGAAVLASRIELSVTEPIAVEGITHVVGCSVGLSWLGPDDDLAPALEQADQRMLAVKSSRPDGAHR